MKLNVTISVYNSTGAVASIEDSDGCNSIELAKTSAVDAKKVCTAAAKKLRDLALRFDALSKANDPFKVTTQDVYNK